MWRNVSYANGLSIEPWLVYSRHQLPRDGDDGDDGECRKWSIRNALSVASPHTPALGNGACKTMRRRRQRSWLMIDQIFRAEEEAVTFVGSGTDGRTDPGQIAIPIGICQLTSTYVGPTFLPCLHSSV